MLLDRLHGVIITYREIPVERLGELASDMGTCVELARRFSYPMFALHTCNRVETYVYTDDASFVDRIANSYAKYGVDVRKVKGLDAVRHLFEVAAGLDSMLIGETDILGQIEEAYDQQVRAGLTTGLLKSVVERAIRVGKLVRSKTAISRGPRGIGSLAIKYVASRLGDLSGLRVGVIGAGAVGSRLIKELRDAGVGELYILNRSLEKAQSLASRYDGKALPLDEESLTACLRRCDAVFTAVSSFRPVITHVPKGSQLKVIVDLGVPRNTVPGLDVDVVTVDSLRELAEVYNRERASEVSLARAIIEAEVERLERLLARKWVEEMVAPYMGHVAHVVSREVSKAGINGVASIAVRSAAFKSVVPFIDVLRELAEEGKYDLVVEFVNRLRKKA